MSKSKDKSVSRRMSKGRDEEQSSPPKSLRSRVGSDDELPSTMFNFNFKKNKKSNVSNQSSRSRNVSGTSLKSSESKTKSPQKVAKSPQKVTKSPRKVSKVIGPVRKKTSTTNDKNGGPESSSSSNTTTRKTHPSFLASLITDDEDDNEEHQNTPITKTSPRKNGRSVREESVTSTMSVSSHSNQENVEMPSKQETADKSNTQIVPSKTNGPTVLAVLVDRNYSEYSRLMNSEEKPYINVPISSPALNYAFPTDYQWIAVDPGVLMTISFNSGTVRTGYIRITPRTVKPFEKTTAGHICLAVVEGNINVKSTSFEFDEKGEPVLKSVELFAGSHISIPNNSVYTVENVTDDECSIYYCMIRS